jgi:hypothetical protein
MRSLLYSLTASCAFCALVGGAITAAMAQDRHPNVRLGPALVIATTEFDSDVRATREGPAAFMLAMSETQAGRRAAPAAVTFR